MGQASAGYDRAEHAAWTAIESLPVPVIAMIRDACRGGGVAIALHADVRIAGDDASFSTPPANLGLAYLEPPPARLVAAVGPSQTKRLLFTAEVIDADRAAEIGLVDEVVPADQLESHVDALVARIVERAPLSHRINAVRMPSFCPRVCGAASRSRSSPPAQPKPTQPATTATTSGRACWPSPKSDRHASGANETPSARHTTAARSPSRKNTLTHELHTVLAGPTANEAEAIVLWVRGVDSDSTVWEPAVELVAREARLRRDRSPRPGNRRSLSVKRTIGARSTLTDLDITSS